MIDGVTILNQIQLTGMDDCWWVIAIAILFFVCLIASIVFGVKGYDALCEITGIICLASLVFIVVTSVMPNGKYKYEVTIDPSVSMTEFYEHYEVLEQRGDIWVVKEKE